MPSRTISRPDGREELVAAQKFDLRANPVDSRLLRAVVTSTTARARQPIKYYENIGEIHFGVNRGAKIAGYAKVNTYAVNKDGTPGKVVTTGRAAEVAAMFASPFGGQRGLIERFFTLMKVPGDCYLIRTREGSDGTGDVTGYDVVGALELQLESLAGVGSRKVGPLKRMMLPASAGGTGGEEVFTMIQPEDMLGRIWRPSMSYVQVADSPMAALDTQCEILHLLTLGLKGKLLSRLALNGILYWPTEVNDIRSGTPSGQENPVLDNKVFSRLIEAASWAIQNFEDPKSALPIFASGPAQYADAIRHIVLDREIYATDMALRSEMLDKILTGLDISKQNTKSDGQQTHFQAYATDDDEIRVNVVPDIEMFMWAATRLVLNAELKEANLSDRTADKYMLWYDLSDANSNVNLAEDARQARDRILINDEASRKAMGFEEADKPEGDELVRAIGMKMNVPALALWGTPEFDKIERKIGWDSINSTSAGPNPASPADTTQAGPGKKPGTKTGPSESDTPSRLKPA